MVGTNPFLHAHYVRLVLVMPHSRSKSLMVEVDNTQHDILILEGQFIDRLYSILQLVVAVYVFVIIKINANICLSEYLCLDQPKRILVGLSKRWPKFPWPCCQGHHSRYSLKIDASCEKRTCNR